MRSSEISLTDGLIRGEPEASEEQPVGGGKTSLRPFVLSCLTR
jgi:hypothetical protein